MNKLRPFSEIGMPWHGLAVNGILTTPAGTVATHNDFGASGQTLVFRNPGAPGVNRNTAEAALDAALGREWRDYVLLTGETRHVNGSDSWELGRLAWLYADTNGRCWRMTADIVKSGAQMDVEIWRRELFGHFGRDYSGIVDERLSVLTWTPTIPSWYTGTFTAANYVAAANLIALPNADGSDIVINVIGSGIENGKWFDEEFPESATSGGSLIGVLRVTISGAGDKEGTGNGISASLTEEGTHASLITASSFVDLNPHGSPYTWDYAQAGPDAPTSPPTAQQADAQAIIEWPVPIVVTNIQGAGIEYANEIRRSSTGICLRTHSGDVTKSFNFVAYRRNIGTTPVGSRTQYKRYQARWSDDQPPAPYWFDLLDGYDTGNFYWETQNHDYDEREETYSFAGVSEGYHFVESSYEDSILYEFPNDGGGGIQNDASYTYTCNGEIYSQPLNLYPTAFAVIAGPTLISLRSDFLLPDAANRKYTSRWIGIAEAGVSQVDLVQGTWANAGDPTGFYNGLEYRRVSFQPVIGQFVGGMDNLTRYQYI
jgi:hypothetical protein